MSEPLFDGPRRFDSVVEKDLDMLLLEEFWSGQHWSNWFYDQLRDVRPDLPVLMQLNVGAARSVSGMGSDGKAGETDLLVVIRGNGTHGEEAIVLLIEDKISAPFTKDQPRRYADRAIMEQHERKCGHRATVLVAPSRYPFGSEAESFDLILRLEEILDYFERRLEQVDGELAERIRHRAFLLRRVCDDLHRYTAANVIPHEGNTTTIRSLEEHILREEPRLRVKARSVRGGASYGPGFDLPSKETVRNAARAAGLAVGSGRAELNFNWFLAEGRIRIRFHSWPAWVTKLKSWFSEKLVSGVIVDVARNGKSLDLLIANMPRIEHASPDKIDSASVDRWLSETIRLQEWFESLADELALWLRTSGVHMPKN